MKKNMNLKVFVLLVLTQVLSFTMASKVEAGPNWDTEGIFNLGVGVSNKKLGAFEKVTCSLTYEYLDANGKPKSRGGQPVEVKVGKPVGILMYGFTYDVSLVPICAADGRCSDIYDIETRLSYKSSIAETKTEAQPFAIQHLSLKVGKVRMTSACGTL